MKNEITEASHGKELADTVKVLELTLIALMRKHHYPIFRVTVPMLDAIADGGYGLEWDSESTDILRLEIVQHEKSYEEYIASTSASPAGVQPGADATTEDGASAGSGASDGGGDAGFGSDVTALDYPD